MRLNAWVVAVALTATAPGCTVAAACPETFEQAESGEFEGRAESTLVGTGLVIRYVPAPDLASRGYDIAVERLLWGDRPETPTFLLVPDEIADVRPGAPVLIVAEPTDRDWVITQGTCVALRPIEESDVD